MKIEEKQPEVFNNISGQLRAGAWDMVEGWLEKSKRSRSLEKVSLDNTADILEDLPTLIGGIARIIKDPMYLVDLEIGGGLYSVCRQFGHFRYETGYQINELMKDFSLLKQELWLFCEHIAGTQEADLFELERRLNMAIDRMAAITIETYHTRSSAEMIELAQKDKLTGCMYFEAFHQRLISEIARSRRYRYPVSLISIDIDNFRRYNLEEGRFEGNRLLQNIAREIGHIVRETDLTARFAGDEFAVLMPETALAQAKVAAERIRRRVRRLSHEDCPTTVSLGIAAYPENTGERDDLLKQSQSALAEAKHDGGDVVRSSHS